MAKVTAERIDPVSVVSGSRERWVSSTPYFTIPVTTASSAILIVSNVLNLTTDQSGGHWQLSWVFVPNTSSWIGRHGIGEEFGPGVSDVFVRIGKP